MISSVSVKRVYEPEDPSDGSRMFIDRLWPRGIKRQAIPEGAWLREVAPSDELRNWYRHDEGRFEEFADRYRSELDRNPAIARLLALDGKLTLLTAVREVETSHAAVLRDYLLERIDT